MKKLLLPLVLLVLCACSTGVGRATSLAFTGVPPTVPTSLDSIEAEYDRLAAYEMGDIVAGNVTDEAGNVVPEALIKQEVMRSDRQARIDAVKSLISDLREWIGVEKGANPTATQDEAARLRTEMLKALMDKLDQANLKAKAAGK